MYVLNRFYLVFLSLQKCSGFDCSIAQLSLIFWEACSKLHSKTQNLNVFFQFYVHTTCKSEIMESSCKNEFPKYIFFLDMWHVAKMRFVFQTKRLIQQNLHVVRILEHQKKCHFCMANPYTISLVFSLSPLSFLIDGWLMIVGLIKILWLASQIDQER